MSMTATLAAASTTDVPQEGTDEIVRGVAQRVRRLQETTVASVWCEGEAAARRNRR
jgi:hypothetical protein